MTSTCRPKTLGDHFFEESTDFVSRNVGIDDQIPALNICLRAPQAVLYGDGAQFGHGNLRVEPTLMPRIRATKV